jgi:hypothetical protein
MQKSFLLIITILIVLFFQRCSFNKELTNPSPFNKENLSEINGKYGVVESHFDSIQYGKQIWIYNNFFSEIDRKMLKDTIKLDSTKTYCTQLEIINTKSLKVNYIEDDKIIRSRIIKTRLKKDGYLYLKNKNIAFLAVPYIAGALDFKKSRLTRSAEGDLFLDVVNHRSGAFMIIAFLDGRTWKYRNEYKKTSN